MRTRIPVLIVTAFTAAQSLAPAAVSQGYAPPGPRGTLIEARNVAFDANYRNDQGGLESAIASMQPLANDAAVGVFANYYLAWTYWSLAGSQFQAKDMTAALASGRLAARHARLGLAARPKDPEFHAMLANALIIVMILDKPEFEKVFAEVQALRRSALELGPRNPRAVMLDASIMFNNPAEERGQERGLALWEEALTLLDAEAAERSADPVAPRWGHALAHGWLAGMYLRMTPPRKDEARAAADAALRMRPDFWWVRNQVLPQLRE
jgi:hypothetical protein